MIPRSVLPNPGWSGNSESGSLDCDRIVEICGRLLLRWHWIASALALHVLAGACRKEELRQDSEVVVLAGRASVEALGVSSLDVDGRIEAGHEQLVLRYDSPSALSIVSAATLPNVDWTAKGREDYFNWRPIRATAASSAEVRLSPGFDARFLASRSEVIVSSFLRQRGLELSGLDRTIKYGGLEDYGAVLTYRFEAARRNQGNVAPTELRGRLKKAIGLPAATYEASLVDSATTTHHVYRRYVLPTTSGSRGVLHCLKSLRATSTPGLLYLSGHFRRSPDLFALLSEAVEDGLTACGLELHNFGSQITDGGSHHFGAYLTLLGEPASALFVEEAVLALETLKGLPGVDPSRIGVAGVSFGGTLSAILGAVRTDIAAVAATAGTVSFESLVGSTGSDAEQHPIGLAALGGMEAVVGLVAPRPLLLLFAEDDPELGRAHSEAVVDSAEKAFEAARSAGSLKVASVAGGHDQGPLKRRAMLEFLASALDASKSPGSAVGQLGSYHESRSRSPDLLRIVQSKMRARREFKSIPASRGPFPGAASVIAQGRLDDRLYAIPGSDSDEPRFRTPLWQLRIEHPKARVLVVDEAGFGMSGFALGLRRCGYEVFLHQPRTFGEWTRRPLGWRRMWLALASASLEQPLALDIGRDLATAIRVISDVSGGPPDVVWSAGPEIGAAVLYASASGAMGNVQVVLSDGPGSLVQRAAASQYPPWSLIVPGLFRDGHDLNRLADSLGENLEITSSRPGLGASYVDPLSARDSGGLELLERIGVANWTCEPTGEAR